MYRSFVLFTTAEGPFPENGSCGFICEREQVARCRGIFSSTALQVPTLW